ncbi:hypothetical protein EDD15DRAFT_2359587 [Pisolithus albus]|nr:hypothetical protein EDD15DRAFT_2359587 [Pisolithus albus]
MAVPVSQSAWPLPANTPVTPQNPFAPAQQHTNPFLTPLSHSPVHYGQRVGSSGIRTYTFKHAAQTIVKEAMQIMNESPNPGPGSEYANAAIPGGRGEINSVTGRKRVDHDWNNCFQPGGGKAGQAPWQKARSANAMSQVAATVTPAPTVATPQSGGPQATAPLAAMAIQCPPADSYFRDLSCAIMEELVEGEASGERVASLAEATFSTILDSGTTTHLIRDPSLFWTFTRDSTVSMLLNTRPISAAWEVVTT